MSGIGFLVLSLFSLLGYAAASGNGTVIAYPPWPQFSPSVIVVIRLPSVSYCGSCPHSHSCCHVGTWYAPSYQCLPVKVTYSLPLVLKPSLPKPKPVYKKPPVVPVTYCKCGSGAACCQLGKAYKCVPIYKPKPVKCGKKTCKPGHYCSHKKRGWWKRSSCKAMYYPYRY